MGVYPGAVHGFIEAVSISDLADRAIGDAGGVAPLAPGHAARARQEMTRAGGRGTARRNIIVPREPDRLHMTQNERRELWKSR